MRRLASQGKGEEVVELKNAVELSGTTKQTFPCLLLLLSALKLTKCLIFSDHPK